MLQKSQLNVMIKVLILTLFCTVNFALAAPELPTLKHITDADEKAKQLEENASDDVEIHKVGATPLSTILAIRKAALAHDWEEAAKYLDMRYIEPELVEEGAAELVRKLTIVWSQQNILDLSTISDNPEGIANDSLASYRDLVGVLESSVGAIPVYLQRVPAGKNQRVWKISNATVNKIPVLWDEFGYSPEIEKIAHFLPEFTILKMHNWQFIAFISLIIIAWFSTDIFKRIVTLMFANSSRKGPILTRFFGRSIRMAMFFIAVDYGSGFLGLSIGAKAWLDVGTLKYLASIYLILGFMELFTSIYLLRSNASAYSAAILRPLMTTLKIIVVLLIILNWFESAGYNIATILTGLGIGSLAIALAAQKTLENVFGAFTIYVAKPIQPGDFCKFGEFTGTVEEIGLRSTRIRKLNRSVVHIPNSVFASKELENFAEIDRRHYFREFRFRLDTSSDQLRQLLIQLKDLLLCHERVLPTAARARFENIERDAFVVVVNCYVDTRSIVDFKAVAEDLNLYILDIITDLGIEWAIPQQQIVISKAKATDDTLVEEAKKNMDELRAEKQMPFPDFSVEDYEARQNTLSYPRAGAVKDYPSEYGTKILEAGEDMSSQSDGGGRA